MLIDLAPNTTPVLKPQISNGTLPVLVSRSGKLRTQKLKSHLMRTQSLKVFP